MLKGHWVTIMVDDLERSIQFYTERLGFQVVKRASAKWCELTGAGLTLGLHAKGDESFQAVAHPRVSIGFDVEQLEAAMEELQARGIEFMPHIVDDDNVRLAFFRDPDHTHLYVCEVKRSAGQ